MKTNSKKYIRSNLCSSPERGNRKGSILIVVVALLGMLLLAGIAFLGFATTESNSAEYFAESAERSEPGIEVERGMDFALKQVLFGPDAVYNTSALFAPTGIEPLGRHSLISNMVGVDGSLFNGTGIHLGRDTASGAFFVDLNYDGIPDSLGSPSVDFDNDGADDDPQELLEYNFSQSATTTALIPVYPAPDVDYTYPDINHLFLGYKGFTVDSAGTTIAALIRPSYHPVELLRDLSTGAPITDWATNPDTVRRIFRPHPYHSDVASGGTLPRYWGIDGAWGEVSVDDDGNGTTDDISEAGWPGSDDFPFLVDLDGDGKFNELGIWSGDDLYELDVDNDGDQIPESVWVDLGYPIQKLPDGREYVPMFAIYISDNDGLLNLNHVGNINGAVTLSRPFGNNKQITESNMALSRSEISPHWALYADPEDSSFISSLSIDRALEQYRIFWNVDPSAGPAITRTEMSNMDLMFMLWGRSEFLYDSTSTFSVPGVGRYVPFQYTEGRWGEMNRLTAGINSMVGGVVDTTLFPYPGTTNLDDDEDELYGKLTTDSDPMSLTFGLAFEPFVHPLDMVGNGVSAVEVSSAGLTASRAGLPTSDPTNPIRWQNYLTGYQDMGNLASSGKPTYRDAGDADLMVSYTTSSLLDEGDEVVSEPEQANPDDGMFPIDEIFGLHASESDFRRTGETSRLKQLATFNFRDNAQAHLIRQQFTTRSFDRAQFAVGRSLKREWEYNADFDGDGNLEFPPAIFTSGTPGTDPREPIRLAVRQILRSEIGDTAEQLYQFRLQLNALAAGFDSTTNRPIFRFLTPHPGATLGSTTIGGASTMVGADGAPGVFGVDDDLNGSTDDFSELGWLGSDDVKPSASAASQEFWARRDRQQMARDIFTLLYMIGGGSETGFTIYTPAQLREMAQFAVNYVDNLDRDNIITRFEYDLDFTDGWNLDDNAFTDEDGPSTATSRGEVFGQERQELVLSEFLAIRAIEATGDHAATRYDDSDGDHFYAYLELRNMSPFAVSLQNGSWRIRKMVMTGSYDPADERRIYVRSAPSAAPVLPGQDFVIGTSDDREGGGFSSDFRVDYDLSGSGSYDLIAPRVVPDPNSNPMDPSQPPASDLDLVHSTHITNFSLKDGNNSTVSVGEFLNSSAASELHFVLERRLDPNRVLPATYDSDDLDNPWVIVDHMFVTNAIRDFQLEAGFTETQIRNGGGGLSTLPNLTSSERAEPLDKDSQALNMAFAAGTDGSTDLIPGNTLGFSNRNSNSPTSAQGYTVFDLHFDRDYASVIDLLSIPLFGPGNITDLNTTSGTFVTDFPARMGTLATANLKPQTWARTTAQARFLFPDGVAGDPADDNRWHRLFELMEVPSRTHLAIQGDLRVPRIPGALNLNTIRHMPVLAGLIDDQDNPTTSQIEGHFNPDYMSFNQMMEDQFESGRNWWAEYLRTRDQLDPVSGYYLPGLPGSKPYRSLNFHEAGAASLQHTILRASRFSTEDNDEDGLLTSGEDTNGNNKLDSLGLFEARTSTDFSAMISQVDPHTRNRLLRKVANNSTNRSNVFSVWITIGYFEAKQVKVGGTTVERVGRLLDQAPKHRAFFVIDRSDFEGAFDTGKFKYYKSLVKYRKIIQ